MELLEKFDNLTYRQIMQRRGVLKAEYDRILNSFSIYEIKLENAFIRRLKNHIYYDLGLLEWQADAIWEYLNGYFEFMTEAGKGIQENA